MASALEIVRKRFPAVTTVMDAKKSLFLNVSQKDSIKANPKDHQECALAKACKRQLKPDGVLVSISTAYVVTGKTATRYRVPEYTTREIIAFDRKVGFTPGTYEFTPPDKNNRLGHRALRRNPKGPHSPHHVKDGLTKRFKRKTSGIRARLK